MKAQKFKILSLIVMLSMGSTFFSCQEDFLETSPTTSISDQDVFQTVEGAQTVMNGLYRWLREFDSGGTQRHEDMGQKSIDITLDVTDGRDVLIPYPAWYYFDHDMGFDYTKGNYSKPRGIWNFYYKIINNANNVIVNIDNAIGTELDKKRIKGEALTLRAYAYFYLINIFQHAYVKGGSQPGVPIYTEPASAENKGNPRGTVDDVYSRIEQDLNEALSILPADGNRKNKSHVNIDVAHGIYARVACIKGEWSLAAEHAKLARENYPLMSQSEYVAGFNNYDNDEWLWGLPFNKEQQHYYYSFFSMYDMERAAGYFNMRLNVDFLALFSESDCRAKFSVDGNYPLIVGKDQPPISEPIYTIGDQLAIRKFRDSPDQTGHYVLMRSAEMILIEAEAEAELGNETKAQDLLFEVQLRADTEAVKANNSGQALIDEILLERRKELYGEGLASLLDIKRRNLPLVREGNHYFGGELPAGSNRFVWQIPQAEIDANDNISKEDQNPL